MKKIFPAFLLVMVILSQMVTVAGAQSQTPYIIKTTKPISQELKDQLNAWLAVDAPSAAPYYIVTATDADTCSDCWIVSLVGVDLESPEDDWSFEDTDTIVWMGSVYANVDGTVTPFTLRHTKTPNMKVFAMPSFAPGGGSYVAFPFQSGTGMLYGQRGVHGSGDYGTTGMLAVDLVSGDDLGASAAPPYVYASTGGEIDYVCDDGTSVAVRTYSENTDDYFIYAHLLDNENLVVSTSFARGELIGNLKYGSFDPPDPNCGWAEQSEKHYHLHWMFVPANGAFQAEECVLTIVNERWTCGTDVIGTGQWLTGGGGQGNGDTGVTTGPFDDVTGTANGSGHSFFEYAIVGFVYIFDRGIIKLLPKHEPFKYAYVVVNTIKVVLRIMWVLVRGNVNLGPLMAVILLGIATNSLVAGVWIIGFAIRTISQVVKLIPGL